MIRGVASAALIGVRNDIGDIFATIRPDQFDAAEIAGHFERRVILRIVPDIRQCLPAVVIANEQPRLDQHIVAKIEFTIFIERGFTIGPRDLERFSSESGRFFVVKCLADDGPDRKVQLTAGIVPGTRSPGSHTARSLSA